MAAKPRPPRPPPDIQEIFALHLKCSQRLDELLEECRKLKAAGKVAAARKVFKKAEALQAGLRALEAEVRLAGNHRRDKRFYRPGLYLGSLGSRPIDGRSGCACVQSAR